MALMMSLREINCALERNNFAHEYMNEYMMMLSNQGMYAIRHMLTYFPQSFRFCKKSFSAPLLLVTSFMVLSSCYSSITNAVPQEMETMSNTHKHS